MAARSNSLANPKVEIRSTPGRGRGVFASTRYPIHTTIMQVTGQTIIGRTYESRYCMTLSPTRSIEPYAPAALINHSCEPNAELVWYPDEPNHLFIETLCNIEPGREILIDYAWPADFGTFPCKCRAPSCRGYIVDRDELSILLRRLARHKARRKTGHNKKRN